MPFLRRQSPVSTPTITIGGADGVNSAGWKNTIIEKYTKPYDGAQEAVAQHIATALENGYTHSQIVAAFVEQGWDKNYIQHLITKEQWILYCAGELLKGNDSVTLQRKLVKIASPQITELICHAKERIDAVQKKISEEIREGKSLEEIQQRLGLFWSKDIVEKLLIPLAREINHIKRRIAVYRTEGFTDQDIAHILVTEGYSKSMVLTQLREK